MPRVVDRLAPTGLANKGQGMHPDGGGLYLQVKRGGRSWIFRYMRNGKARAMGLGSYPDVSLSEARSQAAQCRKLLRDDIDPIEERRQRRRAGRLKASQSKTFEQCARDYFEVNKAAWRDSKHAAQWVRTLETYAYPIFGKLPVQAIDTEHVRKVLDPIWQEKPVTAARVRERIKAVLDSATARGHRTGENPARWHGHLDNVFPSPNKVRAVKHHAAMPYIELPAFFAELAQRETVSAKALAFTILTAARSNETRGATVHEVDFDEALWTVPSDRIKSGREHRVPLARPAMVILRNLSHFHQDPASVLFPNRAGKPMSDSALRKVLKEVMGRPELTVHGFRSTFRDWAAEETNYRRELAETALAHVVKDKTEAAYQRGDLLKRRRELMEEWATYCTSKITTDDPNNAIKQ